MTSDEVGVLWLFLFRALVISKTHVKALGLEYIPATYALLTTRPSRRLLMFVECLVFRIWDERKIGMCAAEDRCQTFGLLPSNLHALE